jgi:hypothetical protein
MRWTDRETLITYLMEGQYSDPVVSIPTRSVWSPSIPLRLVARCLKGNSRSGRKAMCNGWFRRASVSGGLRRSPRHWAAARSLMVASMGPMETQATPRGPNIASPMATAPTEKSRAPASRQTPMPRSQAESVRKRSLRKQRNQIGNE